MIASIRPLAVFLFFGSALWSGCQAPEPQEAGAIYGRIILPYDHAWRDDPHLSFRLAIMVKGDNDADIEDFFAGIALAPEGQQIVGTGATRLAVPRIYYPEVDKIEGPFFDACSATDLLPPDERRNRNLACFSEAFPEHRNGDFELTFQEFSDGRYTLEGMPEGIAFVWIQTPFDGNQITQFPLMVHFPDRAARSESFDIRCEDLWVVFHTL